MNSSQPQQSEPDPDTIKMFVGQIPRSMDENEMRKMFEEFGPVFQINVLRDKASGQSKGCCFVTFYKRKSAVDAQNALHNIKTMPGMHHPIQMKPADSEKRNEERKLFVGMISKKCSENDVRMMFAPFGSIEDCTVLRDQNGQSRGCAFITYANRQSATNAIKNMHHSQTMEGCSSPIVCKFADTQKEKEAKKMQQMNANIWNMSVGNLGGLAPQYLALLQQAAAGNLGMFSNPLGNVADTTTNNLHGLQNLQGLAALAGATNNAGAFNALSMQNLAALNQLSGAATSPNATGSLAGTTTSNSLTGLAGLQGLNNNSLGNGISQGLANSMNGLSSGNSSTSGMDALSQAYTGIQQYAGLSGLLSPAGKASFPNAFNSQAAQQLQVANSAAGKQTEGLTVSGPDGANLFIYHLPQEFSDHDLMQTFLPFGTVISAKVFIDKQTNLSKCFGFVSYDNPVSAQAAIQAMNGFQIGMKRLKVQLKRPKSDSKPY